MPARKFKRSAAERAYRRPYARRWRAKNPERSREINRRGQKKWREKMKLQGRSIRLFRGKWQWVKVRDV